MFNSCISSASESCRKGAIQMYYYYYHNYYNYYNYNYYNYYLCAILKRNGSLPTALALQFGFDTWTIPSPCSTIKTQQPNSCHANIKFTVEFEENSTIPFLDILIKRHNHTFSTSIYRKKTFTGLYTKWDSFTPRKYKVNLIRTLTFRCFRICSIRHLLFCDLVLMN